MIYKIIPGDSQEELIKQAGRLIQVYESGRHIKQAASRMFSRADLEGYAPPKGKFLSHMITMGASDRYGANRNADLFPHEQLLNKHATFVTHGRNYREHRNNDPKLAVGELKAEKYDPHLQRGEIVMWTDIDKAAAEFERARNGEEQHGSMACFPAASRVWMADGSELPIAQVKAGDRVITHRGNIGTVSHALAREYDSGGVLVTATGLPDTMLTTEEHPVWVRPTPKGVHECPVCGEHHRSLKAHIWQKKDAQHQALRRDFGRVAEGWKPASALVPGDVVRTPFSTVEIGGERECYAILLGWYVAEGNVFDSDKYTASHWCTDFTLGSSEEDYIEEIRQALEDYGIESRQVSIYREPAKGRIRIRCRNVELMRRLLNDAGRLSYGVHFSQEIMQWPVKLQRVILARMFEGDGCWNHSNEVMTLTTVSRRLAFQAAEMLWRAGIAAAINSAGKDGPYLRERRHPGTGAMQTTTGQRRRAYHVTIRQADIDRISISKIPSSFVYRKTTPPRDIGHLRHQPVGALCKERTKPHPNVWIEGHFVYRRVSKVKRAPISETVYDLTVPGDHGFVVEGVGVSNCSIPYDLCECCGFKSKTASERCDHIRFTPGAYLPEFRKYAHMINIDPTFKDYSWVGRPADRIAHTLHYLMPLSKAASADRHLRGDELAELYGMTNNAWLPTLCAIAEFDQAGHQHPAKQAAATSVLPRAFHGELSTELLEKMSAHPYPGRVMRSLISRQMVLPLASFNSWVTGSSLSASQADQTVKEASEKLANVRAIIIHRIQREPSLSSAFTEAANQFEPMTDCCEDIVDQFMDGARDQFSLRYEALAKRATLNPLQLVKSANNQPISDEAFGLAMLYNAYLAKTASLLPEDWMTAGQLAFLR